MPFSPVQRALRWLGEPGSESRFLLDTTGICTCTVLSPEVPGRLAMGTTSAKSSNVTRSAQSRGRGCGVTPLWVWGQCSLRSPLLWAWASSTTQGVAIRNFRYTHVDFLFPPTPLPLPTYPANFNPRRTPPRGPETPDSCSNTLTEWNGNGIEVSNASKIFFGRGPISRRLVWPKTLVTV